MHVYKYHNVIIDIDVDSELGVFNAGDRQAGLGYAMYEFPKKEFKKFKKSDEYAACDSEATNVDYSADLFISFLNWYVNFGPDHEITIKVECEHPFWVYHDICHTEGNDVFGCEGQVYASLERERLNEGLKLWQQETDGEMDFEYRGLVVESFYKRFKENIEIPFFQDWEELMYDSWKEEEEYS